MIDINNLLSIPFFSVLESILGNEFVTKDIKKRLIAAGKKGARFPGNCHFFKCNHHLLPQQPLL